MGGPDTIVTGSSEGAKQALKAMEQLTDHHYEILTVPDDAAANCIYIRVGSNNNYLLHGSTEEYPESAAVSLPICLSVCLYMCNSVCVCVCVCVTVCLSSSEC
ncbi:DDAH1 dimethylaminohydrolase, partial [Polyodon spathula]|nr:DDAH1 dimethylaminohydrolase [Polyodon spathula]